MPDYICIQQLNYRAYTYKIPNIDGVNSNNKSGGVCGAMSRKHARVVLAAALAFGLMTMFAMPAAAQEAPEPDPDEGVTVSASGDAGQQTLSLLADVFGVTVVAVDCEFSAENPQDACELTVADQDVPPEGPDLPTDELPEP